MHTNNICFTNQFIFNLNNKCHQCPLYSCKRGFSTPNMVPSMMNLPKYATSTSFRCIAVDQRLSIFHQYVQVLTTNHFSNVKIMLKKHYYKYFKNLEIYNKGEVRLSLILEVLVKNPQGVHNEQICK